MSDLGDPLWNAIDASNSAPPPNGWPEGQEPSTVNNCARAQMGGEKRWWDRSNSTATTAGTSTAYVLTYSAAESGLYDGEETSFVLHTTCGDAPTLNRDGLGAKPLRRYDFVTQGFIAVAAADFFINQILRVRYNLSADRYDIIAASLWTGNFVSTAGNNVFTGTQTFDNTLTMAGAAFNESHGADVASSNTLNLTTTTGNAVDVTGTNAITAVTLAEGAERTVRFSGALTLTNGASLVLPNNGSDIVTAAGDFAVFRGYAGGVVRVSDYQRADGTPLSLTTPWTNWTVTDQSGAGLSFLSVTGRYIIQNGMVTVVAQFTYPATGDGSGAVISLPVAVPNQAYAEAPGCMQQIGSGIAVGYVVSIKSGSTAKFLNSASGAQFSNANLSAITVKITLVYPAL